MAEATGRPPPKSLSVQTKWEIFLEVTSGHGRRFRHELEGVWSARRATFRILYRIDEIKPRSSC